MKNNYYIGIREGLGYTFITPIDRSAKTFFYNKNEKPLAFTNLTTAQDMLTSIRANGFDAILIADPRKVEERFIVPHFLSMPPISKDNKAEFVGQIIDVFEDFLSEKGIEIPNDEKEDYFSDEDDEAPDDEDYEELAIIFGSDYDYISNNIEKIINNWGLIDKED